MRPKHPPAQASAFFFWLMVLQAVFGIALMVYGCVAIVLEH